MTEDRFMEQYYQAWEQHQELHRRDRPVVKLFPAVPHRHFDCANCGENFVSASTPEEVQAEADANFPGLKEEDKRTVCDDCYHILMSRAADAGFGPDNWTEVK